MNPAFLLLHHPGYLEAEKERAFGRSWELVARAEELARVGDFVPVNVLDEPIILWF